MGRQPKQERKYGGGREGGRKEEREGGKERESKRELALPHTIKG